MIQIDELKYRYSDSAVWALRDTSFSVGNGELIVLTGKSGCGKSTLFRCINGLCPNFFEGEKAGGVFLMGKEISLMRIGDISKMAASVFQNPESQFFTTDVLSDLVFACENYGISKENIQACMDSVVALLSLEPLLGRKLAELSGGEKQKVAIMNEFANTYYTSLERMNGQIIEYIRGNKEIRIFGQEEKSYGRYTEAIRTYESSTLKLYHRMHIVAAPATVILSSILVAVLCTGGALYAQGQLSGYIFLLSVLLSVGIGASLLKFTEFMDNFYHLKNGKRLINSLLSAPELRDGAQEALENNRIELRNVSFAYEKEPVLRDVSLVFEEKQKVAIVGPSGAGKTTVANLLARFWDVTGGSITLGGVDYGRLPLLREVGSLPLCGAGGEYRRK